MHKIVLFLSIAMAMILSLARLSSPLFANTIPSNPAASQSDLVASLYFNPVADAYVDQSTPATNYGMSTQLRVDGSPVVRSFLRFTVQGVSGPVTQALLRIYANTSLAGGISVYRVASNTWVETTINYNTAPALGTLIRSSGAVKGGTWIQVDVTPYITGNGTFSLALTNSSVTALGLSSRHSTSRPQLVVTTGPAATATRTATPKPPTPTRTATIVPPTATRTATLVPPTATPSGSSFQPAAPIRAAFFYPWFPQAWTQLGIYPYTNYHPSLGYYSSTDDAIIDQQLRLAAQAHLEAFISSWWGQGQHTDTALQYILGRSERAGSPYPNLRWAIYYENESQGDPSVTQLVSDLQYLSSRAFNHSSYLRVKGKPVVFVYADGADSCAMANRWVQAKNAIGGNLYLVLKVFVGYATCASQPDSWHQYSPAVGYDQQGTLSAVAAPGFWLKGNAVRLVRDPVRFESDVKKVVASGAFWQLITTWNEWGEGTSVEPATEWGNSYIDILTRNLPAP